MFREEEYYRRRRTLIKIETIDHRKKICIHAHLELVIYVGLLVLPFLQYIIEYRLLFWR